VAAASMVTAHGGCKRVNRSLSTIPWHSILRSKRMLI